MADKFYENWSLVEKCLLTESQINQGLVIDDSYIEQMADFYCLQLPNISFMMEVDHITLKFFFRNECDAVQFKLSL